MPCLYLEGERSPIIHVRISLRSRIPMNERPRPDGGRYRPNPLVRTAPAATIPTSNSIDPAPGRGRPSIEGMLKLFCLGLGRWRRTAGFKAQRRSLKPRSPRRRRSRRENPNGLRTEASEQCSALNQSIDGPTTPTPIRSQTDKAWRPRRCAFAGPPGFRAAFCSGSGKYVMRACRHAGVG